MTLGISLPAAIGDLLLTVGIEVGLAVLVLLITYVLSRLARNRFGGWLQHRGLQVNVAILLARLLWIGVWTLGFAGILFVFGVGLTPLAAVIGVVGLAASLALQQVLQNLVAGVYLLAERPFHIGDLIAVVGPAGVNHEGTVEDIQMRTTHLRNRRDELILVPNASIFAGVVTNRTAVGGYVSHVTVTFPRSTDPSAARDHIFPVLSNLPGVLAEPHPQLYVEKAGTGDWTASLLFWISRREAELGAVWEIAKACPEATIDAGDGAAT